ncbi:MAG TPA: recombinase family protein [Streptosporangiaceae bacterium]
MSTAKLTGADTQRVALYLRISKDQAGDGHGVANQRADCERYVAGRPGWQISLPHVFIDNDVSATSGKVRRGWERLLTAVTAGDIDVVLCWAVDRALRTMADYVRLTDACAAAGVRLCSVSGGLDFSTDQGETLGGVLAVLAAGEVKRKAARQRLANEQAALAGKARAGTPRPFGFERDHVTHRPAEADAIRWAADALLGGGTVSAVMRDWNARGLRSAQGGREFSRNSVTTILRNPRIAGLSAYRGEVVGDGQWQQILSEETWRAVLALLGDPARKPPRGVRTLGGGLFRCRCGNVMIGNNVSRLGRQVYRCQPASRGDRPGPHAQQAVANVDAYVEAVIVERLSRPDVADLVTPKRPDLGPLRTEAASIRHNLDELAADRALGLVSREQMIVGTQRGNARLDEISAELAAAASESALAPFAAAESAKAAWDALDRERRRAVIDALCTVTVHPAGRGARAFVPDTVAIQWHQTP